MRTFLKLVAVFMAMTVLLPQKAWAQKIDPMLTSMLKDNQEIVARAKARKAKGLGVEPKMQSYYNTKTRRTVVIDRSHEVNGVDTLAEKQRMHVYFNNDGTVRSFVVFVEVSEGASIKLPEGATETLRMGNTLILNVTPEALKTLGEMDEVKGIRASRMQTLHNDEARKATSANYATGELNSEFVDGNYDGTGVVVGVIDAGIDFNHPAFRKENGDTRIKEAIYFENGVKRVVTDASAIAALTTRYTKTSHGTHTSATAAGSPVRIGEDHDLRGMAPGADLVLCDLGASLPDDQIVAGVKEVFDYATSQKKPAVVNLSLGSNVGFHSETEELTAKLGSLTDKGRIICVSAGNEGELNFTIAKQGGIKTMLASTSTVSAEDSRLTYPKGIDIWANAADNQGFVFKLILVNTQDGTCRDLQDGDVAIDGSGDLCTYINANGSYATSQQNGKHYIEFDMKKALTMAQPNTAIGVEVTGADSNQRLVLIDGKKGDYYGLDGTIDGFDAGTSKMSINTLACTDKVLSVGSYVHRNRFKGVDGNTHYNTKLDTRGKMANYSSYGVDEDDKKRPDFVAPGCWTVSAYNIYDATYFDSNKQVTDRIRVTNYFENGDNLSYSMDRPYAYGVMTGTSMSCPVATGIVALWLQQKPDLTIAEIRGWLDDICIKDKWTSAPENLPSGDIVQAGHGKIDAVRGSWMILNNGDAEGGHPLYATVTIGATGLATYSHNQPLDFSDARAPRAYIASEYKDGDLTLTRAGRVGSACGLLLADEPGDYRMPTAAAGEIPSTNYFVGTANGATTLYGEQGQYVLAKKNSVVGFYRAVDGTSIAEGKAWLDLTEVEATNGIRAFMFSEVLPAPEDNGAEEIDLEKALLQSTLYTGEETGVKAIGSAGNEALPAYNIAGQRINESYRGIFITNGKKQIRR